MERIAQATGGAAFIPESDGSDLNEIFARIASEIRSQYLIQYYSNNRSGGPELSAHRSQRSLPTTVARARARRLLPKGEIDET